MNDRLIGRSRIRVGNPDVKLTAPSHTTGVHEGNAPNQYEQQIGHLAGGRSTAARSTGINAAQRNPIDPDAPNLSPA